MFDLSGRIILQDAFSPTLAKLVGETKTATTELGKLDDATGPATRTAVAQIKVLEQEMTRLRALAKSGNISLIDMGKFRETSAALSSLRGDMALLQGTGAGLSGTLGGLTSNFGSLVSAVIGAGGAFAALQAGQMVLNLTTIGAQAEAMQTVLDNLAQGAGISADTLIDEMRKMSAGTIAETELVRIANRGLLAGGKELADKLPQLLQIARAAAIASGQDIGFVYDTLVKGIVKASPLLIDNAEIYVKVGAAVESYAESVGKTTDELTAQERQQATLNAVLQDGTRFVEQMGLASETAADQMQSLPAAIADIKAALGEGLVEAGVPSTLGELADGLRSVMSAGERSTKFRGLFQEILSQTDVQTASQYLLRMIGINAELAVSTIPMGPEQRAQAFEEAVKRQEQVIADMQRATFVGPTMEPLPDWTKGWEGAGARIEEIVNPLKEFNTAFQAAIDKSTGIATLTNDLAGMAAAMAGLSAPMPEMPELGATALTTDTQAWRDYLTELARVAPEMAPMIAETSNYVGALEQQQAAQVMAAMSAGDFNSALQSLATQAFGAGAGILDLVDKFGQLTPGAQNAALQLGLLSSAVAELRNQANQDITLDVAFSGLERGYQQIDQLALRLAKVTDPETARSFREGAQQDLAAHWQSMGKIDQFGLDLLVQAELGSYQKIVDNQTAAHTKSEQALQTHGANMAREAGSIRSDIEAALRVGLEVTPADIAATAAGTYQDKALESARQLQAIAERGFAELQAHPDWAAMLKIPPDVLSGSDAQLKAWAAQTQVQVENLARPDLINWDAFIANFKQGMQDTAAQELTIDIALGKLDAAGLLGGRSQEQAREDVKQALGLAEPQITFESYFEPAAGTSPQTVVDEWGATNGWASMPVTVMPQMATGETGGAVGPTGVAPITPTINTTAVAQQGTDMAGALYTSFETALQAQDAGLMAASAWAEDFSANTEQFQAIGAGAGTTIAGALVIALERGIGDARMRIAAIIAPEVATILAANRGPLP